MREVRTSELDRAPDRNPLLDHGDRHRQPDKAKIGDGRQETEDAADRQQHRGRLGHEDPDRRRRRERAALERLPRDTGRGARVREARRSRADRESEREPDRYGDLGDRDADERRPNSERERVPEAGAVETNRLCDDLPHSPGLGRQRRRPWGRRPAFAGASFLGTGHGREPTYVHARSWVPPPPPADTVSRKLARIPHETAPKVRGPDVNAPRNRASVSRCRSRRQPRRRSARVLEAAMGRVKPGA